ncbi:hypothetical protein PybrP1_003758 [[Pythium] brassicae (nom. inval.)]|nr:hypothetical protein PybrP1_003758 [[Pythium] brassicae (nom. inval.)]
MGRSQVKFRTTHGRGGRGGRSGGSGGSSSGDGAARRGGRRPLESNAFRYAEDGAVERADEADSSPESSTQNFRRQFFAGEDDVRGPSARPSGAYFQSQTVKQWDEDDDEGGDVNSRSGVLDFGWLGEQLAQVPPSIRYRMDPKYCSVAPALTASQAPTTSVPRGASTDSQLDMLLQLSSSVSYSTARSSSTLSSAAPDARSSAAGGSTAMGGGAPTQQVAEQLEDWLDDVLDM